MGVTWTTLDRVWLAAFLAALAIFPLFSTNAYLLHVTILAMIFAIFAASWNLVTGFAGLKTFGHQAFFAVAAYVSAMLSLSGQLNPWLTLMIGAFAATVTGLAVALPVLRLKSVPHVAIVTLALAEIVRLTLSNLKDFTRGEMGLSGIPRLPLPDSLSTVSPLVADYYIGLALFATAVILLNGVMASKAGLAFLAIRDAQDAAESLGINLTRYKSLAFGLSALMVGLSGGFYAHYVRVLTPTSAGGIELMMLIVAIVLVGGLGTSLGPIVSAFVLTIGLELMRGLGDYRMLIYGVLIMVTVLWFPTGLVSAASALPRVFGLFRKVLVQEKAFP